MISKCQSGGTKPDCIDKNVLPLGLIRKGMLEQLVLDDPLKTSALTLAWAIALLMPVPALTCHRNRDCLLDRKTSP